MNHDSVTGTRVLDKPGLLRQPTALCSGIFVQHVAVAKAIQQQMEPVLRTMKLLAEQVKRWAEMIREAVTKIIQPLKFVLTFRPIYYVPRQVQLSPTNHARPPDDHLPVEEAEYGFFKIDGHKLTVLNPSSSRCGKLLQYLLKHRAEVVDYRTLRNHTKSPDLDKDFKDLKRQLKQNGYLLEYDRPRGQGIVAKGLVYLQ